jgi:hypothetical protein
MHSRPRSRWSAAASARTRGTLGSSRSERRVEAELERRAVEPEHVERRRSAASPPSATRVAAWCAQAPLDEVELGAQLVGRA